MGSLSCSYPQIISRFITNFFLVFTDPGKASLNKNKWKFLTLRVQILLSDLCAQLKKEKKVQIALKAEKCFYFPICASIQTTTENVLNLTASHSWIEIKNGKSQIQRILERWAMEAMWGCLKLYSNIAEICVVRSQ